MVVVLILLVVLQDQITHPLLQGYLAQETILQGSQAQETILKRFSGSGNHLHKQSEDFSQHSHGSATSLPQNSASTKDLLDAAEVTIDLLRAEARMWKQNARKLMIDLERLQKEFSD